MGHYSHCYHSRLLTAPSSSVSPPMIFSGQGNGTFGGRTHQQPPPAPELQYQLPGRHLDLNPRQAAASEEGGDYQFPQRESPIPHVAEQGSQLWLSGMPQGQHTHAVGTRTEPTPGDVTGTGSSFVGHLKSFFFPKKRRAPEQK